MAGALGKIKGGKRAIADFYTFAGATVYEAIKGEVSPPHTHTQSFSKKKSPSLGELVNSVSCAQLLGSR